MLHREHSRGTLVISQPAHAWVSGQMARAWGNDQFGDFAPRAEVELAAELHDIGFLRWEEKPTLDRTTGLPHTFLTMPMQTHLDIWLEGIHQMERYGRYPAVLVSMHYCWLCQQHPHYENPQNAMLVQDFLDTQAAYQTFAIGSLGREPLYAAEAQEQTILRNRQLVSAWDLLSLLICGGIEAPRTIENVPSASETKALVLTPRDEHAMQYFLTPWPFRAPRIELICEARMMTETYKSSREMLMGLQNSEIVPLKFELTPG
ncbi:MAG TPA: DUF3891 family protein [Candidatus Saccharimonadales bacterium]|nr:DUF3891 family protein [Candidatus Saccharimonadales bacterium]